MSDLIDRYLEVNELPPPPSIDPYDHVVFDFEIEGTKGAYFVAGRYDEGELSSWPKVFADDPVAYVLEDRAYVMCGECAFEETCGDPGYVTRVEVASMSDYCDGCDTTFGNIAQDNGALP